MSARVALATCAQLPELGEDEPLLLPALRARGVDAHPVVWDEPAVDWDGYELVVVRSTWDYSWRRDEFLSWAESVPRLYNGADVLRWNTDKRYLAELPAAVTTQFLEHPDGWEPPPGEYVVKPTISAGSRDTGRYGPGDEERARAHIRELAADGKTAIVQPYLAAVDEHGETGLVYFDGEYSHAIRKGQMLSPGQEPTDGLYLKENITARTPAAAELAVADQVLDAVAWPRRELLYARVDLIPGPDGEPRLVELELTEPSLFLSYSDGAPERLAARVLERL